jgi:hypothetical protein
MDPDYRQSTLSRQFSRCPIPVRNPAPASTLAVGVAEFWMLGPVRPEPSNANGTQGAHMPPSPPEPPKTCIREAGCKSVRNQVP